MCRVKYLLYNVYCQSFRKPLFVRFSLDLVVIGAALQGAVCSLQKAHTALLTLVQCLHSFFLDTKTESVQYSTEMYDDSDTQVPRAACGL